MKNKNNVKQNFLQRFSNFNFKKRKKRDGKKKKKRKKEGIDILIITLLYMSPITQILSTLCSR